MLKFVLLPSSRIRTNGYSLVTPNRFRSNRSKFTFQNRYFMTEIPKPEETTEMKPIERKLETKPEPSIEIVKDEKTHGEKQKELRKQIARAPPRIMRLWYLIGAAGLVGAVLYYLNEADQEERKVIGVIRMLGNPDLATRKIALKALDDCLFEKKVLLSTTTDIPQPKTQLVDQGCVEALFDAFSDGDEEVKEGAVIWLIRLTEVENARMRIYRNGLDSILDSINNLESDSHLWLTSTSLLVELSKYNDAADHFTNPAVIDTLNRLYSSANPIAKLAAANIYSSLLRTEKAKEVQSFAPFKRNELALLTNGVSNAALLEAIRMVIPREPGASNPLLDTTATTEVLVRAMFFGLLGGAWGRMRWWFHARRKGLKGNELKRLLAKKKPGRYVFLLMAMDIVAQGLMLWPKEGLIFPLISDEPFGIPDFGVPVTTTIPIAEAGLVVLLSLWAIRTHRYVVLPMALASLQSHWDTVDKYTKPYQELFGININRGPELVFHQVHKGVEKASDLAKDIAPIDAKKAKKDK